jgi:membrane dipeptidase
LDNALLRKLAITLAVAAAIFFIVLPPVAEQVLMGVRLKPPYHASPRATAIAARIPIVDWHADTLLWSRDLNQRGSRGHVDIPRLIEGHVAIQAFTIVTRVPLGFNFRQTRAAAPDLVSLIAVADLWPRDTWTSLAERALYQAGKFQRAAAASGGRMTVLRTRDDLTQYLERRRTNPALTAGFLGIEGAQALEGRLENLDHLFDAGIRMVSPSHFFDTSVGGSSAGETKGGLTGFGRQVVRRMEAKGMIVDVAHASEQTIDDVLAMATKPVVSSHTGVKATCDSPRNLSDRHLRGIAKTGGVIGIAYFAPAVCGEDAAAIARAIRHAVAIAGIEHVALGSDFDGAITEPFDTTGLPLLFDALMNAGLSENDIAAVAGGNALRVLGQALP